MLIEIKKFGNLLTSRPAGREAVLVAKAYILPKETTEEIVLDFSGVDVLSPSWADEFIQGIKEIFPNNKITYINTDNQSVKATLEILTALENR